MSRDKYIYLPKLYFKEDYTLNDFEIIQINDFATHYVSEILELKHISEEKDNTHYDIYLGEDYNADYELNWGYLYYSNGKLLGYITISLISDEDITAYACVLPDYRCHGIFTALLHSLVSDLQTLNLNPAYLEFPVNPIANTARETINYLSKRNYVLSHSEYKMSLNLNNISFDTSDNPLELLLRETDNDDYEFSLWSGDIYVGGCMISFFDDDTACIYDYSIISELRGKGYGKHGLHLILNYLSDEESDSVCLHVSGANKKAVSLYLNCGFIIIEETDYYSSR